MKSVSLADLDTRKKCGEGVEFEIVNATGKGTGIFLTVIGAHAPSVQTWVNKELNNRRRAEALQAKRSGKALDVRPIEEDIDFGIELIAIRILGWRGITEPFSPENALILCQSNPEVCAQVREFSEDIANFTKG